MKHPVAAALNVRIALPSKRHRFQKESTVTTYCEAINYPVDTYAGDDVIAETDSDMRRITPLSNKSAMEYAEAGQSKALRCHCVYDKFVLMELL